MKNGVAYKNEDVYLKINIYLNQACTFSFRPVLPLYKNQFTDLWKKLKIINITVRLKYHKHKTKRNLHRNDRSWQSY